MQARRRAEVTPSSGRDCWEEAQGGHSTVAPISGGSRGGNVLKTALQDAAEHDAPTPKLGAER